MGDDAACGLSPWLSERGATKWERCTRTKVDPTAPGAITKSTRDRDPHNPHSLQAHRRTAAQGGLQPKGHRVVNQLLNKQEEPMISIRHHDEDVIGRRDEDRVGCQPQLARGQPMTKPASVAASNRSIARLLTGSIDNVRRRRRHGGRGI